MIVMVVGWLKIKLMIVLAIGWLEPNRHVKQTPCLIYSLLMCSACFYFLFYVSMNYDHWVLFCFMIIGSCFVL